MVARWLWPNFKIVCVWHFRLEGLWLCYAQGEEGIKFWYLTTLYRTSRTINMSNSDSRGSAKGHINRCHINWQALYSVLISDDLDHQIEIHFYTEGHDMFSVYLYIHWNWVFLCEAAEAREKRFFCHPLPLDSTRSGRVHGGIARRGPHLAALGIRAQCVLHASHPAPT